MSEVKIDFINCKASDVQKNKLDFFASRMRNLLPSGSFIQLEIESYYDDYIISLDSRSKRHQFNTVALGFTFDEALSNLEAKVVHSIKDWRSQRVLNFKSSEQSALHETA